MAKKQQSKRWATLTLTPEQIEKRSESARQGAETRKRNKLKKPIEQDADREMLGDDSDYFEHAGITFGDN